MANSRSLNGVIERTFLVVSTGKAFKYCLTSGRTVGETLVLMVSRTEFPRPGSAPAIMSLILEEAWLVVPKPLEYDISGITKI